MLKCFILASVVKSLFISHHTVSIMKRDVQDPALLKQNQHDQCLRTFVLIVTVDPYCPHKFECHVLHRARALSTKMNNDRADDHCYSFAWIFQSWTFSDPYFSLQKQTLFTIISSLSKNEQKINVGS